MGISFSDLENKTINENIIYYGKNNIILFLNKKYRSLAYDKNKKTIYNFKNNKTLNNLADSELFLYWAATEYGHRWLFINDNSFWFGDIYDDVKFNILKNNLDLIETRGGELFFIKCCKLNIHDKLINSKQGNRILISNTNIFMTYQTIWKWFDTPDGNKWMKLNANIVIKYDFYNYLSLSDALELINLYGRNIYFSEKICWKFVMSDIGTMWLKTDGKLWILNGCGENFISSVECFNHYSVKFKMFIHKIQGYNDNKDAIYELQKKSINYNFFNNDIFLKIILNNPYFYEWISTYYGIKWLDMDSGKKWLNTDEGQKWVRDFNLKAWPYFNKLPDDIKYRTIIIWVRTEYGLKWFKNQPYEICSLILYEILNISMLKYYSYINHDNYRFICNDVCYKWLSTQNGHEWLSYNEDFLKDIHGKKWLESFECYNYINIPEDLQFIGIDWLDTKIGKRWLTLEASYNIIASDIGWNWIMSFTGWEWFNTDDGYKFLISDACKKYVRYEKNYIPLTDKKFAKYFKTENGIKFLFSSNGKLFIEWFKIWRSSDNTQKWLVSKDYEEFHKEQTEEFIYQLYNPIEGTIL
jgi:hypothetical protein